MKTDKTLTLNRFGLRFIDDDSEHAYRDWRLLETLPIMRIGALIGLFAWLCTSLSLYHWAPIHSARIAFSIWYVAVPIITTCVVLIHLPISRKFAPALIIVMLNTSGFVSFWQGGVLLDYPGPGLVWALLTAIFASFVRLPVREGFLASGPYILYAIYFAFECNQQGELTPYELHTYTSGPLMAITFILVLCGFFDRLMRQNFADQQQMAAQNSSLQKSREVIRRYVPPALADQIETGETTAVDSPLRKRVTVLFSDIVDFTRIADQVEAETITQIINDYMSTMATLIDEHHGTVNEFIGDGLMALFGAPEELEPEDQAQKAIAAAQAMQNKMPELNRRWRKLGLGEELKIRIGINTGVLSVGSFGSEGRMTYTAIGLQTNIAARIQSHCEPGGILISDATYALVEGEVDFEPRGEVECKGVHFPIKVYRPLKA